MLYIQDIFSCGVSRNLRFLTTNLQHYLKAKCCVKSPRCLLLSGTTGACRGEHSSALPGSVLFQKQALRRGLPLRPAMLRLQRCKLTLCCPAAGWCGSRGNRGSNGHSVFIGSRRRKSPAEADLTGSRSDWNAIDGSVCSALQQQHSGQEGVSTQPHLLHTLTSTFSFTLLWNGQSFASRNSLALLECIIGKTCYRHSKFICLLN